MFEFVREDYEKALRTTVLDIAKNKKSHANGKLHFRVKLSNLPSQL